MILFKDCYLLIFEYEPHAFWLLGEFSYLRQSIKSLAIRRVQTYLKQREIVVKEKLPVQEDAIYVGSLLAWLPKCPQHLDLFFYYLLMHLDDGQEVMLSKLFNWHIGMYLNDAHSKHQAWIPALEMIMAIGIRPERLECCFSQWTLEYNEALFCQRFQIEVSKGGLSYALWVVLSTLIWKTGDVRDLDKLLRQEMRKLKNCARIVINPYLYLELEEKMRTLNSLSVSRREKEFVEWVQHQIQRGRIRQG